MGLLKAKVYCKNDSKVTALLDTGIKINVMIRKLIKDVNLAIKQGPKLELVFYTGHNHFFLGFCEDVEVAIKGLKTRHQIFVLKAGDYDLVLGQLF